MRILVVAICILIIAIPTESHCDKYAGEFMAKGGGARAMGMGGAFTAIADDATATFWNPAGLSSFSKMYGFPKEWEMALMHSERFGDLIDYNYFSAAFPLKAGKSGWGVSLIHMGIDDIRIIQMSDVKIERSDGDDRFEPEPGHQESLVDFDLDEFPLESVNDYALLLSYAQLLDFGAVGWSIKLIRNDQVTDVTSFGIGVDVGFLRKDLWRSLTVGAKLQDATGTYISWSTGKQEYIYPTLKIGLAYPFTLKQMSSKLILAIDGDFRYENLKGVSQFWIGRASADFHLGAELLIRELVALRGGLDVGRPTAGVGFVLSDFGPWNASLGLDYALLVHDELDATHRISLLLAH